MHLNLPSIILVMLGSMILACGARDGVSGVSETGESGEGESEGGESGTEEGGTGSTCVPGMSIPCACPGGEAGAQVCADDGMSYGECDCGPDDPTDTSETGDPGECLPSSEPYPADYTINAQEDINEISHYSVIAGSLRVSGNSVISLEGMTCLQRIGNQLIVEGTTLLPDLSGLANVETIQGEVEIFSNTGLTTLAGMSSLQTIGWFSVYQNLNLSSVDEFPALETITGSIGIENNVALPTCNAQALRDQVVVGGSVCIEGNQADECEEVCG